MRRVALAAVALSVVSGCQPTTPELTEERKAEIVAEVNLRHDQLWDALRNPDADRVSQFWHHSPAVIFAAGGGVMYGYSTIDSIMRPMVDRWESQELTVADAVTVVLSHDVVYTMRVGTDAVTLKSGETGRTRPVVDTYVWTLRDGEWKVLYAHESHGEPENP